MVSGNGKNLLSDGSYSELELMVSSLETGTLEYFTGLKHLLTDLDRKGFDLREYPRRLREFENDLVRKSEQGDIGASTILLEMSNQLEQRMDGVYSEDIKRYREAARRI